MSKLTGRGQKGALQPAFSDRGMSDLEFHDVADSSDYSEFATMPERSVCFDGDLRGTRAEELGHEIKVIADSWVSDDIVIDLRDVNSVETEAVAAIASAASYARHLGHRVLIRADKPIAQVLDSQDEGHTFVVVPK